MELLRNAVFGWQDYKYNGKFVALLLLAILYLALNPQKKTEEQKQIRNYGAVTALLCIFPPTAAILMGYQTRFFDYEWIWSIVPITMVIALGGTLFLTGYCKRGKIGYNIFLVAVSLGILMLSGKVAAGDRETGAEAQSRAAAEQVLAALAGENNGEEIYLWAPREIMEYARALDGRIILPYGRNMWDMALNAYSYDVYAEEVERLYLWMERTAENGEWEQEVDSAEEPLDGTEQILYALQSGVNHILLKSNLSEDSVRELRDLANANSLEIQQVEGFYLLKKR